MQGMSVGLNAPTKVRVLKPKSFNVVRNAKELENFL